MKNHNFAGNSADMSIRYLYFIILIILSAGCKRHSQVPSSSDPNLTTVISGQIVGGNKTIVTLDRMGAREFEHIDSVRCDDTGRFRIEWSQETMEFYALKYTEQGYITLSTMPGEQLMFMGNDSSTHPYTVIGSPASRLIAELASEHKRILEILANISTRSQEIIGKPEYVSMKEKLNSKFDSVTKSFAQYSRDFIHKNSGSPATLIALYNLYGPNLPVFDPSANLEIYREVDSTLFLRYPENEAVGELHADLQAALEQLRLRNKALSVKTGSRAPDFVIRDIQGKSVSLSEFTGYYVFLHFWASWSKPSIEQQANIQECRTEFDQDDLIIIQVSLDDNRDKWIHAIQGNQPGIIHTSELNRWESAVSRLYEIERIPANFLIDRNGVIVEKDIFGSEIEKTIAKYVGK